MDKTLFKQMLLSSYPKLSISQVNTLVAISHEILNIAICGNEKYHRLENWSIIDAHTVTPSHHSENILVRGAGQSRYNPMKWERAYNLKDALAKQLEHYDAFKDCTKLGVLLTDIWRPVELYEYAKSIEKFERLGISSVAILFSAQSAIPIKWPWR